MFEDTLAEDEADLQAQLQVLQGHVPAPEPQTQPKRQPRREKLPEHLRRVVHRHEPENTTCPTPQCGQPMVRIGEDVSERLDIVPAEFFVHRHIRGKWGSASAASIWCRSRQSRRSSTRACPRLA